MDRVLRLAIAGTFLGFLAALSVGLGVALVIAFQVFVGDDSNLKKSVILAKINEESTIYFQDEKTPIGSFFENAHRRYVSINEIPQVMIDAIVAGEDKNFFSHQGIDVTAIFRAFAEGVQNRQFRKGGSTITQQTVKNIINRWEPTFQRKFKEWIAAMQLERMYTKKEILEFYLNQFHVAQNGNGIAIAVEYYFDKQVGELTLNEAAFIAGSVKAPSKYNPFIKFTKESREKAIEHANDRKNYVLGRMFEQRFITKEQLAQAQSEPIQFKKGKFGSNEVSLIQLVKRQLNRDEIFEAIGVETVDDLSRAGLRIITTIDPDLQDAGQLVMRRRLSSLETTLKGYGASEAALFKNLRRLEPKAFYYGKVTAVKGDAKNAEIEVDFGLPKGVIPYDALVRFAKLIDLASARGPDEELKALLKQVKVGDIVYVEVLSVNDNGDQALLELFHKPAVNGGLIAIDQGQVRAAIPGFDTIGFNRSWDAQRQPGSVFKSVVFFGACQLGWSILDNIDNQRQVFPYQRQLYFPKPDHPSPYRKTSMLWAGIMSENLASVHLTYRLTEKLSFEQFKQLMGFMDLLPYADEAPADFHYRVAKKTGVQLTTEGISEQQLHNAIRIDLVPDLTFSRNTDLIDSISKMWWGRGYEEEIKYFGQSGYRKEHSDKERAVRLKLVKNNFMRTGRVSDDLVRDWQQIQQFVNERSAGEAMNHPLIGGVIKRFRKLGSLGARPELAYYRIFDGELLNTTISDTDTAMFNPFAGVALTAFDVQMIWDSDSAYEGFDSNRITLDEVRLEGFLPLNIFRRIKAAQESRFNSVRQNTDKYDLYGYFQHHDFRVALGLNYLVNLAKAMGVRSPLEAVLSFPLGSNVVSIGEVAKVYQTFISGKVYRFFDDGAANQINLIKRIVDRDGNELYAPVAHEFQLASHECALQMREILEKIVTHGTGRRARGELHVNLNADGTPADPAAAQPPDGKKAESGIQVRVPAFGKTGTTNDYNTSSFAGFLPYPTVKGEPLNPENSYVIASYVGYDIPETMRRGRFKVSGSMGALPVWTDFAKATIDKKKYADFLDTLDLNLLSKKEWPLRRPPSLTPLTIDLPRGLVMRVAGMEDYEQFAATNLNQTGEEFQSEFAHGVGRSVNSVIRVPSDTSRGSWQPLKVFSPFRDFSKENAVPVVPSKVQDQNSSQSVDLSSAANTQAAPDPQDSEAGTEAAQPAEDPAESETAEPGSGEASQGADQQAGESSPDDAPATTPVDPDAVFPDPDADPPPQTAGEEEDKPVRKQEKEQNDATDYIEEDLWH